MLELARELALLKNSSRVLVIDLALAMELAMDLVLAMEQGVDEV